MKIKNLFALLLTFAMVLGLFGCSMGGEKETTAPPPYVLNEDSPLQGVPTYDYGTYVYWQDMGEGAEMLTYQKVWDKDKYLAHLELVKNGGFTLYSENNINGNYYASWINENIQLNTIYMPELGLVRLVAEPLAELPGKAEENVYQDAGMATLAVQVGVNYDGLTRNGMCYIYRLCDGSFIIVDSGFNQEKVADAIYDTLVALAPESGEIVIAAWIFSHAHSDHTGGFYAFTPKYADKVKLEQVIYNFPTTIVFEKDDTSVGHITKLPENVRKYQGARIVEAHPGQKFFIRDCEIEVLYTWEMFPSSADTISFFNESCIIFTLTMEGQRIMQLGDCAPNTTRAMEKIYGESLKSDFIQVAHHGMVGASETLNKLIGADVVMWPASDYRYEIGKLDEHNKPFQKAKALYVAGQRVTVIPLPYNEDLVETWVIEHYTPAQEGVQDKL